MGRGWDPLPGAGGGGGGSITSADDPTVFETEFGADLGYDQEFDGSSSALPTGWAWLNQGTATYVERLGAGTLSLPSNGGSNNWRGLMRAAPTEATWTATFKIVAHLIAQGSNKNEVGIALYDGTKLVKLGQEWGSGGVDAVALQRWGSVTSFSAGVGTLSNWRLDPVLYMRIRKNSVTSWDFQVSHDGRYWQPVVAANDISGFMTPTHLGFVANCTQNAGGLGCEWFRVR